MVRVYKRGQVVEVPDWPSFAPPPPPTTDMVKQEASRRILTFAPDYKQRNMLARSAELLRIGEANLTQEQRDEVLAIERVWETIQMIRTRSDAIEAMDPIPSDYAADKYWA